MDINIRTFAFIIGVTHIIQFIVIYYQFKINKNYNGIGWWLLWSGTEVLGFFLIVIRSNFITDNYLIVPQNSFIIAGTLFVYAGIMVFFGKRVNWKAVIFLFTTFLLLISYFAFINESLIVRTIIINATLALISFFTVYNIYKNKFSSVFSSVNFLTSVLILHGIIFTYLTIMIAFANQEYKIYEPNYINLIQYTDAFMAGLLWTFGFIIMINQRLNSEHIEDKDQLELILNASPESVLLTNIIDGHFIRLNDGFTSLTGYTREDVIGKTTPDINLWGNPKERETFIASLNEKGIVENQEVEFRRKDGSIFVGMVSAKIIQIKGVSHIISVTRNIDERKQAEKILHESEDRLARAEKVAKIGNWKLMLDTKEIVSSIGARIIYGIEKDKMYLEDVQKIPLLEYRKQLDKELDDLIINNIPYNIEFKIQRPNDGKIIDIHSLAEYDKENRIVYGIIHDITDRKAADGEIQRKNEQLQRINSEKDKFFSIIAHDLRSPFNGFLGLTELMVSDIHTMTLDDLNDIAGSLHSSANNLFRLLTNLLEWSMIQRGLTEYKPERLSIKEITEESTKIFNDSAKRKGIYIDEEIPDEVFVMADKSMLETIIRNLVSNAIKFSNKGGKVIISAKRNNGMVEISIKDSGIGMSDKLIKDLFKIDKQTSRTGTDNEPSTGLGLLLCKELVEKNNGKIKIISEEGKGSEFVISLMIEPSLKSK